MVKRLPDVVHREPPLRSAAARSVGKVRAVSRTVVLERVAERFANVTLDFDGSVLSTGRHAEGTAVGFNKKKKGARSYYPLFAPWPRPTKCSPCTIDPGNVHDSNGASAFIERCVRTVRESLRSRRACAGSSLACIPSAAPLHLLHLPCCLSVGQLDHVRVHSGRRCPIYWRFAPKTPAMPSLPNLPPTS